VSAGRFEVELPEGDPPGRHGTLYHAQYGSLDVDKITRTPHGKRVRFVIGGADDHLSVEFSGDELREMWGDVLHASPHELAEAREASSTGGEEDG